MKFKKMLALFSLIICMFLVTTLNVNAADPYLSYGSSSNMLTVQPYSSSYNSTWVSILNNARTSWNNSLVATVTTSSSSSNTIQAANYSDTWYGLCSQTYSTSSGYTTKFTIKVNARTISNDATNFANFARSTTVHEFGHVLWLCDNPNTTSSSIMKYSRNRNTMYNPQTFDKNNVKKKYNL